VTSTGKGARRDLARLVYACNEPRGLPLLQELRNRVLDVQSIDFDDVDKATRAIAGALSYHPVRGEWYANYQMHPLVQRRRSVVFNREVQALPDSPQAILMWGSWFHPWSRANHKTPYFHYIDQSRALEPAYGEPVRPSVSRIRSHALQRDTYSDCEGIFCMSRWAQDQTAAAHPGARSRCEVVGWGPCSLDLSGEPFFQGRRDPVVLHVSNDFHRKGIDFLIETSRRVKALIPQARFVVVGTDKKNPRLGDVADVEFIGQIKDRDRLAQIFRESSLFFLPHRFDRSPHVLVEAMSAGLPLVVSQQGGAIELVEGTGTGGLVEVGDVEGYSKAICDILWNTERAAMMGQKGKDLVRAYYNWSGIADRICARMTRSVSGLLVKE